MGLIKTAMMSGAAIYGVKQIAKSVPLAIDSSSSFMLSVD